MKFKEVMDAITGRMDGRTMWVKRLSEFAPSTAAASSVSWGICCSPARRVTVVWGIPTHTPTTITAGRAVEKSPSQFTLSGSPSAPSAALRGPPEGV